MHNNHLKVIDLSDNIRGEGLIKTTRSLRGQLIGDKPIIHIVSRKNNSLVSKWADISSFSSSQVYRVVKYRRQNTIQRYGCQCIDFLMRKNPNEGKGHSRTCKHIRYFRELEKQYSTQHSSNLMGGQNNDL